MTARERLLDVRDLCVRFDARGESALAVDGVSLSVDAGETLGIVGESGSGKSATCCAIMGLVPTPPGTVAATAISFRGRDLLQSSPRELRALRGRDISMVFQDPMTSLNPLMTIGRQLGEVLEVHERCTRRLARSRARDALADVGIADPDARLDAYPHELSGGMRQRAMIAMALLCRPKLLFADEPTTALDVTIQAQILELLKDLQRAHGTAIVLVTHSLGVVAGCADRVLVMYAGRVVESAPTRELFARPSHPYTRGLLASVPRVDGVLAARLRSIPGQPPSVGVRTSGCTFRSRCALAIDRCERETPELEAPADAGGVEHRSACFRRSDLDPREASSGVDDNPHAAASTIA
jgi:oligopeptide/dipeptide ABC transporter ATP-binding protein